MPAIETQTMPANILLNHFSSLEIAVAYAESQVPIVVKVLRIRKIPIPAMTGGFN